MRIGIPRALSFYRYYPLWEPFFEALGAEVVVSPPTTRVTLEAGMAVSVAEMCLPVKLFLGHVRALIGEVDALFVPAIHRLAPDATNCAKLIGLPDLVRNALSDVPPLIAPDVDLAAGALWQVALETALSFTYNPLHIKAAAERAWQSYQQARADLRAGRLSPADFAPARSDGRLSPKWPPPAPDAPLVAVVGHPYLLYDPFVNHNLLLRLRRLGLRLLLPEQLSDELLPGSGYWTFESELVGAAERALVRDDVAGIIAVSAFGCGPDGVMLGAVTQAARGVGRPLLLLSLDEHSGEAGLVTRIEAFTDMLVRRRR